MANVLIVDSYPTLASLYREILEEEGHGVLVASNGKEAIELASQEKIDIVIVGERLPDYKVNELLEKLKQLQPHSQGTLCAVVNPRPQAHEHSCDVNFIKSSDFTILLAKIRDLTQKPVRVLSVGLDKDENSVG